MVRSAFVTLQLLILSTCSPAIAQRGGPSRGGDSSGGGLPAVGTKLPDVSAFDEQGEKFSTSSLRGSYTVLVFGCLT
jgi:cytochrome oxidase Cu insertion factor (SCO1/SenC/PrrC family)